MRRSIAAVVVCLALASFAPAQQDPGRRAEVQQSLASRYRVTRLGGTGFMGRAGKENAVISAGGTVVVRRNGLFGSYDRGQITSNAIRGDEITLLSGRKDAEIAPGEKFYVTSVYVGSDIVNLGLLSTRMISSSAGNGQLWAQISIFMPAQVLAEGVVNKIYPELDKWLLPEGGASSFGTGAGYEDGPVDLKPGMSRDDAVKALGNPIREVRFEQRGWLQYPSFVVLTESGKVTTVDNSSRPPSMVRVSSEPPAADVLVDGKFVGNTAQALNLEPGEHEITVQRAGYKPWARKLQVSAGTDVNIHALLEK
jgi:hypothetical protein